jgi:sterol desaturase/sphingolipid hydroxylase (fatty acid hydroxylase superfamily)
MVPIYVLGLAGPVGRSGSLVPVVVALIGAVWGFFIHANLRWRFGPFEQLIATPAFHHWHHTRVDHIDHNYSPTLPWMDRIFGTFYLPKTWPEEYGTDTPVPASLPAQLLHPITSRR